ncbi:hypothetical protein [Leisingera sp. ANG-Vp]|uniref:hypothetical protein n=1 Tax=Leisingera sp. ANG-Vp TaxID=1577896 RepID=UPI001269E94D|nr:hypothetical protein [Leisingera sp. ANG-Vp]
MGLLKSWFAVAKGAWISMILGYSWVLFSLLTDWKVPASGAILICASLIAEIRLTGQEWNRLATRFPIDRLHKVEGSDETFYRAGEVVIRNSNETLDCLRAVARGKNVAPGGFYWSLSGAADDVNQVVNWFITVSAILGSVLWGYGDLLFST